MSHDIPETTLGNIINYLLTSKTEESESSLRLDLQQAAFDSVDSSLLETFSPRDLHKTPTLLVFSYLILGVASCSFSLYPLCVEIPHISLHFISNTDTFITNTVLEISPTPMVSLPFADKCHISIWSPGCHPNLQT